MGTRNGNHFQHRKWHCCLGGSLCSVSVLLPLQILHSHWCSGLRRRSFSKMVSSIIFPTPSHPLLPLPSTSPFLPPVSNSRRNGFVESRIRFLIMKLESTDGVQLAHPWTETYSYEHPTLPHCQVNFVGLSLEKPQPGPIPLFIFPVSFWRLRNSECWSYSSCDRLRTNAE